MVARKSELHPRPCEVLIDDLPILRRTARIDIAGQSEVHASIETSLHDRPEAVTQSGPTLGARDREARQIVGDLKQRSNSCALERNGGSICKAVCPDIPLIVIDVRV